ncbi:norfluorocurarine oxidase-like [Coffea arabica]|uniref:Norfluorocurarine oxidase-like n=1 Tax=Coffea arabica TaxID=13443 RepID=A0A6P6X328_COFAR|nr:cytochrome P450 71A2-like [Coffea arabica]
MALINLDLSFFSNFSLLIFLLSLLKWFFVAYKPQKKLPPSPPKLPIIGNLHQLGLFPHRSLQLLSRKYGPLMLLRLGSKAALVASSSDAACQIMKTHDLFFANRPKSSIAHRLLYGSKDIAFSPYGEYWRQVKSISVLHLLSNKRIQSSQHVREEETSHMIEKISQTCSSSPVNLSDMFLTLTNDIICRVALGRKYSEEENGRKSMEYLRIFVELLGCFDVGNYIPWLAWVNRFNGLDSKMEKAVKQIDGFLEGVIEEHINKRKGEAESDYTSEARCQDFVDIMIEIKRANTIGFALDRDAMKAIILDVFGAGTDTTHSVMEWGMSELLKNPEILQKLQAEVREVTQGKPEITRDDMEKMQYLKAVIKETLRLHTPVPLLVPRESIRDVKVMGYDIPKSTQVFVNAWAIARDPMLWENPEEFRPERFLDSSLDFRGLNFELIPFGAGRRICPGIYFAISVNELALAKLVNKFNFTLPDGIKPNDLDMTEAPGVTIHRKLPLHAIATPYSF